MHPASMQFVMNHRTWVFFRHGKKRRLKPSRCRRTHMSGYSYQPPFYFVFLASTLFSFFFFFKVVLSINRKPGKHVRGGDQPPPTAGCNNTSFFTDHRHMPTPSTRLQCVCKQLPLWESTPPLAISALPISQGLFPPQHWKPPGMPAGQCPPAGILQEWGELWG